jgi:universal stress protein F
MYKHILVPIDLNDKISFKSSIGKAVEIAKMTDGCKISVMTVIQTFVGVIDDFMPKNWMKDVEKKTLEELKKIVEKYIPEKIETNYFIDRGVIYQSILDRAAKSEADLIVMSAHHPNRRDYLLGPNSARVVRHTDLSVLIVREEKN